MEKLTNVSGPSSVQFSRQQVRGRLPSLAGNLEALAGNSASKKTLLHQVPQSCRQRDYRAFGVMGSSAAIPYVLEERLEESSPPPLQQPVQRPLTFLDLWHFLQAGVWSLIIFD